MNEVRFTYRLRPRNRSVDRVPTLVFHYHNPATAEGKNPFPLTTAKERQIVVTPPRPRPPASAIPLGEPEWLQNFTPLPVSESRSTLIGNWIWLVIALAGPIGGWAWFLIWRRVYPNAGRLARMRRTRAARRALEAIRRTNHTDDSPAVVAHAVLGYLRARFPLSPAATTPTELGLALVNVEVPPELADEVSDFFRSCDASRFAPLGDGSRLTGEAIALISRLEAT
jgi:hypothetical protein